ncbi:diphosphate--fructose-6-phosphate 1-phosphotransferase [Phyllobacterium salinisoli]|uniref:Pyrophosphate--fructose 6-phosphate 1-phosphotransferase n=1 Tax=Phyllobacterium salinisoli TaxID=1899321 RepID=A0A368K383_9HYPH|nr:diphosphate--fructose-6-phosphate 1-phosphotransferase [Phyllobacterium salinisoli]RCS23848.1 diphosphate--fructose-6-phosphate 1-phosphotransferase [Phyllobacterium salinisoli]
MTETFVIAQGGGPTAVINQTLAGVVLEARRRYPGARVLGARHGVRGIRDSDFVDLMALADEELKRIGATPSAALGSTRDKPDQAYCEKILKGLRQAGTTAFVYIGGNDTAGTQQILAEAAGGDIAFVHAPKTIDNDLVENDHTPGFISAAEFVAGAFLSVDLDFRALPGVYVGIVMGRHAGFLTAAAAAWRQDEESGPHLVYVPERAFSATRFIDDVSAVVSRHGRCVVAMSEGVSTDDGRALVETLVPADKVERDAHGNIQLSGGDLGMAVERLLKDGLPRTRSRVDTFGYLPRGNIGMINPTDAREAFEAGVFAVEAAARGGGSVALQYENGATVPRLVPLADVAGKTRHMPDDFLLPDANQVSSQGMAYMERLLPRRFDPAKPFV